MKIVNPKTGEEFRGYGRAELIAWMEGTTMVQEGSGEATSSETKKVSRRLLGGMVGNEPVERSPLSEKAAERRLRFATRKANECESLFRRLLESRGNEQEEVVIAQVNDMFSEQVSTFDEALDRLLGRIKQLESAADDVEWQFTIQASLEEAE